MKERGGWILFCDCENCDVELGDRAAMLPRAECSAALCCGCSVCALLPARLPSPSLPWEPPRLLLPPVSTAALIALASRYSQAFSPGWPCCHCPISQWMYQQGGTGGCVPYPCAMYAGQHCRQGLWLPLMGGHRLLTVLLSWNCHYLSSLLGYSVSIGSVSEIVLDF